jgi:hypothetical protein
MFSELHVTDNSKNQEPRRISQSSCLGDLNHSSSTQSYCIDKRFLYKRLNKVLGHTRGALRDGNGKLHALICMQTLLQ